jgi:hypothetical protein
MSVKRLPERFLVERSAKYRVEGFASVATVVAGAYNDTVAAAWRIGLTADTTTGGLAVTATGEANKTIRWVARVLSVEVTA